MRDRPHKDTKGIPVANLLKCKITTLVTSMTVVAKRAKLGPGIICELSVLSAKRSLALRVVYRYGDRKSDCINL